MITDLRWRVIPDWISLAALVGGVVWHSTKHGWAGLATSAAGALAGFAVFLIFYLLGGMGGGDIKLMAGFGSLLGPPGILIAAVFAAVAGGIMAAAAAVLNRKRRAIPYAPAIVLGSWLALLAER